MRTHAPRILVALVLLLFLGLSGLSYVVYRERQRSAAMEQELAQLRVHVAESSALARQVASSGSGAGEGRSASPPPSPDSGGGRVAEAVQPEARRADQPAADEMPALESALGRVAEVRRTAAGLVMNLGGDDLEFESGEARLSAGDRELLSRIAGVLLASKPYRVEIVGHTDDKGSAAYNQRLSERRARAVRDYFVEAGLSPAMLSAEGAGESKPLAKGTSDSARARNRRVEILIVRGSKQQT